METILQFSDTARENIADDLQRFRGDTGYDKGQATLLFIMMTHTKTAVKKARDEIILESAIAMSRTYSFSDICYNVEYIK